MKYNYAIIARINKIMEGKHEVSSKNRLLVVSGSEDKVVVPRNAFYEGLIFKGVTQERRVYRREREKEHPKSNINKVLSFRYPQ